MKKILTVFMVIGVVMAMSASFIACEEEIPSEEEIVSGIIESLDDVESYEMEMDMEMRMSGEDEGMQVEVEMTMAINGVIDFVNEQVKMVIDMSMAGLGEDPIEMAVEMYIIDDMTYAMMDMPLMGPRWVKSDTEEEFWDEMDYAGYQVDMLRTAQVEVIGSERVGGIDCYVLQVTPDMEELWELMMEQAQMPGGELPDVSSEELRDMFRSFSVKYWIAKDTYFIAKADIEMVVDISSEAMDLAGDEGAVTMDVTMSMLAYNYNESVTIVLPPEAEDAVYEPTG